MRAHLYTLSLHLPVGALEATVLAKLQALEKLAWIITKNKVATALTEVEKIFAQIPDLADIIKIYFVIKAVHPGLASRISYTTEGKDLKAALNSSQEVVASLVTL